MQSDIFLMNGRNLPMNGENPENIIVNSSSETCFYNLTNQKKFRQCKPNKKLSAKLYIPLKNQFIRKFRHFI